MSVEELQTTFGDNDRLAAMVTNLIRAPLLVLLSDVEGLYDGDPRDAASRRIPTVMRIDEGIWSLVRDRATGLSKGGMASKLKAAQMATTAGESVIIASGKQPGNLAKILAGEQVGTLFVAEGAAIPSWKRWIGFTAQPRGKLTVDAGARRAVETQGAACWRSASSRRKEPFAKGTSSACRIRQAKNSPRGLTNYATDEVLRIMGLKTDQIAPALGHCPYDEVIHRDNLTTTRANGGTPTV